MRRTRWTIEVDLRLRRIPSSADRSSGIVNVTFIAYCYETIIFQYAIVTDRAGVQPIGYRRRCGSVVRTSVGSWRTFPDLRLIHGWCVTTSWVRLLLWLNQLGQVVEHFLNVCTLCLCSPYEFVPRLQCSLNMLAPVVWLDKNVPSCL